MNKLGWIKYRSVWVCEYNIWYNEMKFKSNPILTRANGVCVIIIKQKQNL